MTNTNQISHVSSSKQLQARISGAFKRVLQQLVIYQVQQPQLVLLQKWLANTYVGSGAQLFDVNLLVK